jgi:hypothetical protein
MLMSPFVLTQFRKKQAQIVTRSEGGPVAQRFIAQRQESAINRQKLKPRQATCVSP